MCCGFFKQMLLILMEDSLLTFPNQQYMMNDNVYYCILSSGLASQKTDNVTNWSISVRKWCVHWAQRHQGPQQCPPHYHWQLLFASDDHFDHLLWAKRISSAKYVMLWAPWVTHHPWSRTQCLWHRAGHQQWRDRKRDRGEKIVNRENKWMCPSYIFQSIHHQSCVKNISTNHSHWPLPQPQWPLHRPRHSPGL